MNNKLCIIMTTVNTKEQANAITSVVLEKRLVACVQIREIESHYVWNGEVCNDSEVLIWLKTEERLYSQVEDLLNNIHPYDVPEIICVPVDNVSKGYAEWVHSSIL